MSDWLYVMFTSVNMAGGVEGTLAVTNRGSWSRHRTQPLPWGKCGPVSGSGPEPPIAEDGTSAPSWSYPQAQVLSWLPGHLFFPLLNPAPWLSHGRAVMHATRQPPRPPFSVSPEEGSGQRTEQEVDYLGHLSSVCHRHSADEEKSAFLAPSSGPGVWW